MVIKPTIQISQSNFVILLRCNGVISEIVQHENAARRPEITNLRDEAGIVFEVLHEVSKGHLLFISQPKLAHANRACQARIGMA